MKTRSDFLVFPLILMVFFSSMEVFAQQSKIDSLSVILPRLNGTKRMELLIQLGIAFVDRDNLKALKSFEEAHAIASKTGDSTMIVKTGRMVGQLFIRVDSIPQAIALHLRMLDLADRNQLKVEHHRIANSLASAYTWQGNYFEALRYNFIALNGSEAVEDKEAIAVAMNNIGLTYLKLENYDGALKYFLKSLNLKMEMESTDDISRLYFNAGLCYTLLGKYDVAFNNINAGFSICGKECNDHVKNEGLLAMGIYYKELGKFTEAELYFTRSLAIARKLGNRKCQIQNLKSLARISLIKHNLEQAYTYLSAAESIVMQTSYENMKAEIFEDFAEYYRITRHYEKASLYYSRFVTLTDSLFKSKISETNRMRSDFDERENQKTIRAQSELMKLKDDALEARQYVIVLLCVVALLLFAIIFVLIRHNRRKTEMNQLLDTRVKERTVALHTSYNELLRISLQQQAYLGKTFSELNGHLKTFNGLLNLLVMDPTDRKNVVESTHLLISTSEQLSSAINKFKANTNLRNEHPHWM